ncbi:hypothetical protein NUACC26_005520 [Scytonema sp. NUACC26]
MIAKRPRPSYPGGGRGRPTPQEILGDLFIWKLEVWKFLTTRDFQIKK